MRWFIELCGLAEPRYGHTTSRLLSTVVISTKFTTPLALALASHGEMFGYVMLAGTIAG